MTVPSESPREELSGLIRGCRQTQAIYVAAAGFRLAQIIPTRSGISVIEGEKDETH